MSRKLQFVVALLILSSFSLGTLNAMPSQHPRAASHEEGMLMAVVDWITSLFSWDNLHGKPSKHPRTKVSVQVDPDGGK
ncbi:MAG TPA: hypothetical protein VGP73_27300 [Thermoanaerobaculia bacterium]